MRSRTDDWMPAAMALGEEQALRALADPDELAETRIEHRRRARIAMMTDASACARAGWSAAEWEERAVEDDRLLALYGGDRSALEREADHLARYVWRIR